MKEIGVVVLLILQVELVVDALVVVKVFLLHMSMSIFDKLPNSMALTVFASTK